MKRKTVFSLMLATLMAFTLVIPAAAANHDSQDETTSTVSETEVKIIDLIFDANSNINLMDGNKNIREDFIAEYQELYDARNYDALIRVFTNRSLTLVEPCVISEVSSDTNNIVPYALKRTARATRTIALRNPSGVVTSNRYTVTLEADYSVIDSNNTINGAESTMRIVAQENNPPTWASKVLRIKNERATISDARQFITFSGILVINTYSTGVPGIGGVVQEERVSFRGSV